MREAGSLYDCPPVLKRCFYAYVLPSLEYCASVLLSSAESHLVLLDSTVPSAERLCKGELCCSGHRRKVGACVCYIRFITEWTTL